MALLGQDWEPVILRKRPHATSTNEGVSIQKTNNMAFSAVSNRPAWAIERQVDADDGKPIKYVSKEAAIAIKTMREQKKYLQSELNTLMRLAPHTIQKIESGKFIENKAVIADIKRRLEKLPINPKH